MPAASSGIADEEAFGHVPCVGVISPFGGHNGQSAAAGWRIICLSAGGLRECLQEHSRSGKFHEHTTIQHFTLPAGEV
jgi:hypothetical protein